jgi:hypothetical protein
VLLATNILWDNVNNVSKFVDALIAAIIIGIVALSLLIAARGLGGNLVFEIAKIAAGAFLGFGIGAGAGRNRILIMIATIIGALIGFYF